MIAVCMGYSKTEKLQKGRLNNNYIFFDNEYGNFSSEDINRLIKETDSKEKNIGLIHDWNEKGFSHYYEWFYKKWSKVIGTKEESNIFKNMLKIHKIL